MTLAKHDAPNLRRLRNRPVCIICGRPAEAKEIAKALGILDNRLQGHEIEKVNDGHTFYLGSFKLQEGELEYYVTSSLRQGIQSFTVNAGVLFSILLPRFVVHAGVCAGYDDPEGKLKLQLTDVVFGDAAINYEEGKWENVPGKGLFFRPDYNRVSASAGDMQAFAESRDRPRYRYGEYISGSAVRTDSGAVFEKIRSGMQRNAIALDMEASAFIQLCEHFGGEFAKCLGVVKGISDFGNSEKGKDENAYSEALKNTALGLQEWITHSIPVITWEVDENHEPGAKIVPGYYKNFVSRVLDNFCQGWAVTLKTDNSVVIPRKDIKGFKTILPKRRQPEFFSEMGNIMAIMDKYDIWEVTIGGVQGSRSLYYKAGYLMDWSRCCNSLAQYEDGVHQVGVFERVLRKNHYYSTDYEGPAKADICTWEDTEEWLREVASKESVEQPKSAAEKQKVDDAEGSSKKDATNHSNPPLRPQLKVAKLNATTRGPDEGDHSQIAQSPSSPHTFPLTFDEVGNKPLSHAQPSKTEFTHLKKKFSMPQVLHFFNKKNSKPPEPRIRNEA